MAPRGPGAGAQAETLIRPAVPIRSVARGRWSPLALALLCAHCSLSFLLAGIAILGGGSAIAFGVDVNYVWPPVLILGGFAWYVWSGRRAAARDESCELPARD